MGDDRDPKALTFLEAWVQLSYRLWQFVEALFSWWPWMRRHAALRWSEQFVWAVDLRAEAVGREQALRDYFGEGDQ